MSTHPVNCLHDTLEAVPQTRDIDNAEGLAEIPLHRLNFLNLVIKIPQIFLQFRCPSYLTTNSVKALKEAILSPGPYNK